MCIFFANDIQFKDGVTRFLSHAKRPLILWKIPCPYMDCTVPVLLPKSRWVPAHTTRRSRSRIMCPFAASTADYFSFSLLASLIWTGLMSLFGEEVKRIWLRLISEWLVGSSLNIRITIVVYIISSLLFLCFRLESKDVPYNAWNLFACQFRCIMSLLSLELSEHFWPGSFYHRAQQRANRFRNRLWECQDEPGIDA